MGDKNVVELNPGDYLVREKDPCDGLYIIKEGQLEVFKTRKNGSEKIPLAVVNSGEYIGEFAVIMERAHSSNVVALTKVVAVKLPRDKVLRQLKAVPPWLLAMTCGLVDRIDNMNQVLKRSGVVDEQLSSAIKAIMAQVKETKSLNIKQLLKLLKL